MPYNMLILPRTDPGGAEWLVRKTRSCRMRLRSLPPQTGRLPHGPLPRLVMAWVWTQARRNEPIVFDPPFFDFAARCGADYRETHLLDQLERLVHCALILDTLLLRSDGSAGILARNICFSCNVWSTGVGPGANRTQAIVLEEVVRQFMKTHAVVLDTDVLRALLGSSFALDLYLWLAHYCFVHNDPFTLPWRWLYDLFAGQPVPAPSPATLESFRIETLRELSAIEAAWPQLRYECDEHTLTVMPVMVAAESGFA